MVPRTSFFCWYSTALLLRALTDLTARSVQARPCSRSFRLSTRVMCIHGTIAFHPDSRASSNNTVLSRTPFLRSRLASLRHSVTVYPAGNAVTHESRLGNHQQRNPTRDCSSRSSDRPDLPSDQSARTRTGPDSSENQRTEEQGQSWLMVLNRLYTARKRVGCLWLAAYPIPLQWCYIARHHGIIYVATSRRWVHPRNRRYVRRMHHHSHSLSSPELRTATSSSKYLLVCSRKLHNQRTDGHVPYRTWGPSTKHAGALFEPIGWF